MKILFMGTPAFAVPTLEALMDAGHEIALVITQPDKPGGRGKRMQYSPVKICAVRHELPVYQPKSMKDPEVFQTLRQYGADVAVVVAYGQILPESILKLPALGCINVHASLLPAYRGAAPMQWAIINGETETGVTIMKMNKGLDTGDILAAESIIMEPKETGETISEKLSAMGAALLVKTLSPYAEGKITPKPQGEAATPYASVLQKDMGCIRWERSAVSLERLIRGLTPWPCAFTKVNGRHFKILSAGALSVQAAVAAGLLAADAPERAPGEVALQDKKHLGIQTGDGILLLEDVQPEGKSRMSISDFMRGNTIHAFGA